MAGSWEHLPLNSPHRSADDDCAVQVCASELQLGAAVWGRLAQHGALDAALAEPQVAAYLAALGTLHLVACLLQVLPSHLLRSGQDATDSLRQRSAVCLLCHLPATSHARDVGLLLGDGRRLVLPPQALLSR